MDLDELKALLRAANKEAEETHQDYSRKSATHKAALQIMQLEKNLHYGDVPVAQHIKKIREIIDINAADIINETN